MLQKLKEIFHRLQGEVPTEDYIKRGMKVGKNLSRLKGVIFDYSHCWHITIGDNVTLAPRVHILAHDASCHKHTGYTRIGNVKIGNNVFIGAGSIILPGVEIGDNAIIGAGSIVSHSIPANTVAAGQPAKVISTLEDHLAKIKGQMEKGKLFDDSYTERQALSDEKKREMVESCDRYGNCFVK